jgi:hypothetical protein
MSQELYELSVQGTHNGEFVETVMHFEGDNLTSVNTLLNGEDLINSWFANVKADFLATLPASYTMERLTARRVVPAQSGGAHLQFTHAAWPGTLGSISASYQLCPTVFLIPTMGTKTGGKIFMPALATTQVGSNVYAPGYITAIDNFIGDMVANFGTGAPTWQLAVYSRKHGTWASVVAWQLSTRFGFQSRRRKPVGA